VDLDVSCDTDQYRFGIWYYLFILGAATYPFFVPLGVFLLLRYERRTLRQNHGAYKGMQKFEKRYMFLVADYKEEYYYWDCVEMMRCALHVLHTIPPQKCLRIRTERSA
jgi:hypothetical protein